MKLLLCISALVATIMANDDLEKALKNGNDQFTANMFQEVAKAQKGKSCVLSAFSVLSPLGQLALASTGPSHDEILKTIGFANDDVTKEVFSDVNKRLKNVQGVELKQANKVYVRTGFELNDQFAGVSKDVFNSEVQNIDFSNKEKAAADINAWVEDNTNKRIKNLVDPNALNDDTSVVLVNAIYFKGKWLKQFNANLTQDLDFHVTKDKTVKIPMMTKTDDFKYGESAELDAKILEMQYEGEQTSLVVVLPNKIDGIDGLVEKLKDPAALNNALNNMYTNEVIVTLPKFKIETTTNLKEVLQKMNINKLFTPGEANLSKLLKGTNDLYVSDAVQKAFIEVNEEGAEAAAANAFVGFGSAPAPVQRIKFNANHPFAFFLKVGDDILFNGVFLTK